MRGEAGNQWRARSSGVKGGWGDSFLGEGRAERKNFGWGRVPAALREERGTATRRARAKIEERRERACEEDFGVGRERREERIEARHDSQQQRDHSHFLGRGGGARQTEKEARRGRWSLP